MRRSFYRYVNLFIRHSSGSGDSGENCDVRGERERKKERKNGREGGGETERQTERQTDGQTVSH